MYFHIILTTRCNSKCRYCYKKSCNDFPNNLTEKFDWDFSTPETISYSLKDLKKFIEKDKDPVIIFYGGEPLLEIGKIKEIMDSINSRFIIQTNAKLFDSFDTKYVNRFEKILVSIDGDEKITDFNKGKGTYAKVIKNVKLIKKNGFKGEIIARMVVDEYSNLIKEVLHLLTIFDSVHWQLDAGFYKNDYLKRDFSGFINKYNKEVKKLINIWVEKMEKGKVLRIYPFLGIFNSIYYNKSELLRCGSGFSNYTISTNGKISVCPIMHDSKKYQVGDIFLSNPEKLKRIFVSEPCTTCDILNICGGRCLYANKAKLWPEKGQKEICNSVRFLISEIKSVTPKIGELIKQRKIKESDFVYEKYFGPEIIP